MQRLAQQRQNGTVPPESCFTNGQQTLVRPCGHGLAQTLLQKQALLLRLRRSPALEGITAALSRRVGVQHPFELSPIQLGDATGVGGAEHRLERLRRTRTQSQNSGGTGEENVLHAD